MNLDEKRFDLHGRKGTMNQSYISMLWAMILKRNKLDFGVLIESYTIAWVNELWEFDPRV